MHGGQFHLRIARIGPYLEVGLAEVSTETATFNASSRAVWVGGGGVFHRSEFARKPKLDPATRVRWFASAPSLRHVSERTLRHQSTDQQAKKMFLALADKEPAIRRGRHGHGLYGRTEGGRQPAGMWSRLRSLYHSRTVSARMSRSDCEVSTARSRCR
jgi:hypothetical protein